jgi:hypothetical protein
MEATQTENQFISTTESFASGVASAKVSVLVPQTAWGLTLKLPLELDLDATVLIAYLAAKIGGPIPAEVAVFLETALKAI